MAIQVQQRQQERSEPQQPKEDIFDKLVKGLQIANGVMGIKSSIDQSNFQEFQQNRMTQQDEVAAQQRVEAKQLDPFKEAELAQQGFSFSSGNEGPQPDNAVQFQTPEGTPRFGVPGLTVAQQATFAQNAEKNEKAAQAAAAKIAKDDRKSKLDKEKGIRGEYVKASDDTTKILNAFNRVKATASVENPSGSDDIALINGAMRVFDPGVSVREGDVELLRSASSVPEWLIARYENALAGNKLGPTQRQELFGAVAAQYKGQIQAQMDTDKRFKDLAERAGADVEDVLDPRYAAAVEGFGEIDEIIARMAQGPLATGVANQPQNPQFNVTQTIDQILQEREATAGGR